jgi:hypothetical protein
MRLQRHASQPLTRADLGALVALDVAPPASHLGESAGIVHL